MSFSISKYVLPSMTFFSADVIFPPGIGFLDRVTARLRHRARIDIGRIRDDLARGVDLEHELAAGSRLLRKRDDFLRDRQRLPWPVEPSTRRRPREPRGNGPD